MAAAGKPGTSIALDVRHIHYGPRLDWMKGFLSTQVRSTFPAETSDLGMTHYLAKACVSVLLRNQGSGAQGWVPGILSAKG
jgi:hypothetical protein